MIFKLCQMLITIDLNYAVTRYFFFKLSHRVCLYWCMFYSLQDYVGPGHCTIPCVDQQGEYGDTQDGPPGSLPVEPAFTCYTEEAPELYRVWFGYNNPSPHNVYISDEGENFVHSPLPSVMPPTQFASGNFSYAFSVG